MASAIKLIVGLGNPGPQYHKTRHNVGNWFVTALAEQCGVTLRPEAKFKSLVGQSQLNGNKIWLLAPLTYMNCSGEAVQPFAKFYKILPEEILVVHDELDFPPGTIRLKQNGGHGGHNGLRNIISHLNNSNFSRLRIGIGRPSEQSMVTDYVLHAPSKSEQQQIEYSIEDGLAIMSHLISGDFAAAMQILHQPASGDTNGV